MPMPAPSLPALRKRPSNVFAITIATGALTMSLTAASSSAAASEPMSYNQRPTRPAPRSPKEGSKQMNEFQIGDTVRIIGAIMSGNVGTVVSKDEKRRKYLVRITDRTQNYYPAEELEHFRP